MMDPRDAILWLLTCRYIKRYMHNVRKIGELC